jgi:glycosyltransferase involved in cell wall biosynthesis
VGQLVALGEALRARGDELLLAFPRQRPWLAELQPVARIIEMPEVWHPHRMNLYKHLEEICRHEGVDLLHLHYAYDLALALYRPGRRWPIPVVYHWRNPPRALLSREQASAVRSPRQPTSAMRHWIRGRLGALAARVGERVITHHLTVSREIHDLLLAHRWTSPEKVSCLPNPLGIAMPAEAVAHRADATGEPVIGSVANFLPQKDHETLLRAFRLVLMQHPECRLRLAGDGPLRAAASSLAAELGIAERVEFGGYVADPTRFYPSLDLFAHATHYEGQGMVLLEALAHGLPVVATDLPSIRETITSERDGLLAPARNPQRLAEALMRLIADPALRARLGAAGRERVREQYRVEEWVVRIVALYEEILSTAGAR